MLGLPDPTIWLAYIVAVLSMLACIVYGIVNWNKGNGDGKGGGKK